MSKIYWFEYNRCPTLSTPHQAQKNNRQKKWKVWKEKKLAERRKRKFSWLRQVLIGPVELC